MDGWRLIPCGGCRFLHWSSHEALVVPYVSPGYCHVALSRLLHVPQVSAGLGVLDGREMNDANLRCKLVA